MDIGDRRYRVSHPWITFRADLRPAPHTLWVALGEVRSKIEHIKGAPLRPDVARELYRLFLVKGVRATTAIEGNTLSEEQVRRRLDGELKLPPSQEYLGQEIDNIEKAIQYIAEDLMQNAPKPLTVEMIKHFNRLVLTGLALADGVVPGEIRTHSVGVGSYLAAPAEDCSFLLESLVEWLNGDDFETGTSDVDMKMILVIIKAVIAHLYLAWIHPFGDGNGRTSRLLEFQIIVAAGAPFPVAHLLSNHYNVTRSEYYRQLEATSKSGGNIVPFLGYAVQGFLDGLRDQISHIQQQQIETTLQQLIHEKLAHSHGPTTHRRRLLMLALLAARGPIPRSNLRSMTPQLAEAYAGKTGKTLTRDLNALQEIGLVARSSSGWRAKTEIVQTFLPARVE